MNYKKLIFCVGSLSLMAMDSVNAESYAGIQFAKSTIEAEASGTSVEWEPTNLIFNVGKKYGKNASIEGRLGLGLGDDSINGVTLEASRILGVYGKFSVGDKVSPYVILGLTNIELDSNVAGSDDDSDFSYGIGADIELSDKSAINIEYMNYYDDSEGSIGAEISAIGLGYQFKF